MVVLVFVFVFIFIFIFVLTTMRFAEKEVELDRKGGDEITHISEGKGVFSNFSTASLSIPILVSIKSRRVEERRSRVNNR